MGSQKVFISKSTLLFKGNTMTQRTPEQLRAAIRRLKAELDYPASGTYTRYCREQIERLEKELAVLEGQGQVA